MNRIVWETSSDSRNSDGWSAESGKFLCRISDYGPNSVYLKIGEGNNTLYSSYENAKRAAEEHFFKRGNNGMKDIWQDIKGFLHDNRNIVYWIALAFLVDHFFLNGAFRARLNALVEKMIGRVEKQIEAKA